MTETAPARVGDTLEGDPRATDGHAPRGPIGLTARPGGPLRGVASAPGDKSISHRALILGALARGATDIEGLLEGDDVRRTAGAMRAFGARVERLGEGRWRVQGAGALNEPAEVIDCGNAGTGARLIMGAAAGFPLTATFTGDASLRGRPMGRVLRPLGLMGAAWIGRQGDRLPLSLRGGGLRAIHYRLPEPSAQVKSAILLAGLGAEDETRVIEPVLTRDHTERMLRAFGAEVFVEDGAEGRTISLRGGQSLAGTAVRVPGDPSSAAFPVAAALLVPGSAIRIEGVGLNPLRAGLFATLREMGADITVENQRIEGGEPVGDLVARHGALRGIDVPWERAPSMIDEYPVLAVIAACAEGTTRMRGLKELRVKESDRLAATAAMLATNGVRVEVEGDDLIVHGTGRPPEGGGVVETHMDHRLAMSALVMGLASARPVRVDDVSFIDTSFPGFVRLMNDAVGNGGSPALRPA